MNVFIVRPFGTKNNINFDRVETELIRPAMRAVGLTGGTTGEFVQQGNIRTDMFELLLIADLVIADVSIHNANVFYELGLRHALRDKRTFLLKSAGDDVPFDLKTDRYLPYDANDPAASVGALARALEATLDSQQQDSPVYQLLPDLEPADPDKFLIVPLDFREEVEQAEARKSPADLALLTCELEGFAWRAAGLRLIGMAQFRLKDWHGAKTTWKAVREYDDMDLEANTQLATVYQKLGDMVSSDQAVERALQSRAITNEARAEILALKARNAKTLWTRDWEHLQDLEARQASALMSPHLERSYHLYCQGFSEDRNHFYSGLNALAMLTILTELAQVQPTVWEDNFDAPEDAPLTLQKLKRLAADLAAGVKLAIASKRAILARTQQTDTWAEISAADLSFLASTRTSRIGQAYKSALAGADAQARESARNQLVLYQQLGILTDNTQAALQHVAPSGIEKVPEQAAPRVILFTGHRIDAEGREKPRFPRSKETQARALIHEAVEAERKTATGPLLGIAGGASGGDILFHEVCQELGIPTLLYLALPQDAYRAASVADSGAQWVERFQRLCEVNTPIILADADELPRWLRAKNEYTIWQRSNLWMLQHALTKSNDNLTLIALWNGDVEDGPGGTEDMVNRAKERGSAFIHLDTRTLLTDA
ncbi:MAG: hypothetical protein HOP18_19195 [Deltaproteobacteria bacterium]|nr:hypothetical protein [Deltaproteobacteria bacterium]